MKPLLPTLKEKKRYIVFEVIAENFDKEPLERVMEEQFLRFMGENGYSKAGIMILNDCWKKNKGILKVGTKYLDEAKMSLGLMKGKMIVNVVGVSGTLNKAKQKFM